MNSKRTNAEGFRIDGKWNVMSQRLKRQFPQLTDDDLNFEAGKESDLLKRMEAKLGKKRDEIMQLIKKSQFASG